MGVLFPGSPHEHYLYSIYLVINLQISDRNLQNSKTRRKPKEKKENKRPQKKKKVAREKQKYVETGNSSYSKTSSHWRFECGKELSFNEIFRQQFHDELHHDDWYRFQN